MYSIKVDSGVRVIEVNDQGETITLYLGDERFMRSFYALLDKTKTKADEYNAKWSEEDIMGNLDASCQFHEELRKGVDDVFGEGTCRKVFGNILPGSDLVIDFFNQIMPIVEEYRKSRGEKLSKYSAGRTGSV